MDCHDRELSILFTDDDRMAELNSRYLGRSGPTNVLAFPMMNSHATKDDEGLLEGDFQSTMLGDIVISVDTALREALSTGESEEEIFDRLLIHGLLHLLGYDHVRSATDANRMEKEEKRLLSLTRGNR